MKKIINLEIDTIIKEVKAEFIKIYGTRLQGIILFGSYARSDSAKGSDIDILLLKGMNNISSEREKYFPAISDICLKYDQVISIIPCDSKEFIYRRTPLILNVQKEGIRI